MLDQEISKQIQEKKKLELHIEKLQMHIRTMSELLQKTVKENGMKTKELKELRDEIVI